MTLTELLAKVREAKGANYMLEIEIADALGTHPRFSPPPQFTASIDAALALVERVMPGCAMNAWIDPTRPEPRRCQADIFPEDHSFGGSAPTLPLAICAALLSALIAREAGK